jgi:hypothetical protein
MVGTAAVTDTTPGINSAASLAAQSGPTRVVTADAAGNLATANFSPQDISALSSSVGALQQSVGVLQQSVGALQAQMRQSFEGTAIAIAIGGGALPADKKFALSTNWGNFRSENAIGVTAQLRLTEYAVFNAGFAAGTREGGVGTRAGFTLAW